MTTEEKARAYDEALKVIKECNPDENGFITIYPQEIFSELKESEDERIRKALIRFHKSTIDIDGIKGEEILAWLEKQGGPKHAESEDESIREAQLDYWRSVGGKEWHGVPVQETIAWLEKQDNENNTYTIKNTPNCAISVYNEKLQESEDERIRKEIFHFVLENTLSTDMRQHRWLAWIESLKERMKEKTIKFRKGNIITNGKIEYEIRDIQKNQLGDWVYILYNDNIARLLSNGLHLPDGSIRWICEQIDGEFKLKL